MSFKPLVRAAVRCEKPLSMALRGPRMIRPMSTSPAKEVFEGAIKGVKIVDLSRVLAAPFCTQILADYGADVIKVEEVGKGDDTRYWQVTGEDGAWKPEAGPFSNYFASANRNKRSICLNLKHERGRKIFLDMVRQADVVVDNFKPGTLERLKLDYEQLKQVNPRIIHASIAGYGAVGPWRERPGYDMIAGAEGGLMHLTGTRDGPPVRPGLGLTDISTGLFTHGAILAALLARGRTGLGQKIDASLFETQIALLTNVALTWLNLGQEAQRWGAQHPSVVPYDAFKTKDLYFVAGASNDRQFSSMCQVLGVPELAKDERFLTNKDRVNNRQKLYSVINEKFLERTTDEWIKAFEGKGVAFAPINTMERVFSHPQTEATAMIQKMPFEASSSGNVNLLGPAVKFSDTAPTVRTAPPLLGQHTDEILGELGLSESEIEDLYQSKTIGSFNHEKECNYPQLESS